MDIIYSMTVRVEDFNNDNYADLLATGMHSNLLVWFQHPGKDLTQPWTRHVIDDEIIHPAHGHPFEINGDNNIDVVIASGMFKQKLGTLLWYENEGSPEDGNWTKHVICKPFPEGFDSNAADFDGDGDLEVIGTTRGDNGSLILFNHHEDGMWEKQVVKKNWINAGQVLILDLDGDGRQDIVANAERGSNDLRWWKNEGRSTSMWAFIKSIFL